MAKGNGGILLAGIIAGLIAWLLFGYKPKVSTKITFAGDSAVLPGPARIDFSKINLPEPVLPDVKPPGS